MSAEVASLGMREPTFLILTAGAAATRLRAAFGGAL
jgi:hypothetical protein